MGMLIKGARTSRSGILQRKRQRGAASMKWSPRGLGGSGRIALVLSHFRCEWRVSKPSTWASRYVCRSVVELCKLRGQNMTRKGMREFHTRYAFCVFDSNVFLVSWFWVFNTLSNQGDGQRIQQCTKVFRPVLFFPLNIVSHSWF